MGLRTYGSLHIVQIVLFHRKFISQNKIARAKRVIYVKKSPQRTNFKIDGRLPDPLPKIQ